MSSPVETYTFGQTVQIPIRLKDEDGIGRVIANFKRQRTEEPLGPPSVDPRYAIVLEGDGGGQTEATVQVTSTITGTTGGLPRGDYVCVSIFVYDAREHLTIIERPSPSKVIRLVGEDPEGRTEFLGWG